MGVYRRGNTWYIDFYVRGQRIRKKIGPSRKLAELALKDAEVKIAKGDYLGIYEERKIPFSDYAKQYLEYSKTNKAKRSYERDVTSLRVHLVPYFGRYWLANISTKMIEDYKAERKNRVNPATVNRELACLKNMFTKAVEWGYLKANPAKGVKLLKEKPKTPRYLTKEEVCSLLEACPPRIYALVATAVNTGMRRGELLNLEWTDVDLNKRTITVRNKEEWHTKNYESRTIPVNDFLYEVLSKHPHHIRSPYVFCNPDGSKYNNIWLNFEAALKKAGIEHLPFHSLRHTFASHLVMSGVDLATVQKLLGHKNIKTTMRYSHLAPDHLKGAVERLDFSHKLVTSGKRAEKAG